MTASEPQRPAPGSVSSGPAGTPGATGLPDGSPLPVDREGAAPPVAPPQTAPAPSAGRRRGRAAGRSLAAALLVFVTVVLVLFVVFNTQAVDISLVFGNVNAPLVLALVIAAALGGLVVGLSAAVVGARRRSRNRAGAQAG